LDHEAEFIHSTRLPNGALVITEAMPGIESVAFGLWADAGSADEDPAKFGVGHFLEHMLFKGTEQRSAYALAEAIEDVGGQLNAYTEQEITHIYARVLAEDLPVAVDLLADMLCRSAFPPSELERERQVIIEEIRKYDAQPDERINDLMMAGLWQDGGLGHPILGNVASVSAITRADLLTGWRQHFAADRVLITAVGAIEHDRLVEMTAAAFAELPPSSSLPAVPLGTQVPLIIESEDSEQVNFCWGGRSYSAGDARNFPLAILDATLGSSTTSRLFQEIREKRGLAYDIGSDVVGFRQTGLVCATGATSPDTFDEVLALVKREIDGLYHNGITPKELARAKEQMKVGLALSLEGTLERMRRLATHQFTWHKIYTLRYLIDRLNAVTMEEVEQVIAETLDTRQWTFTAIGPVDEGRVKGIIGG